MRGLEIANEAPGAWAFENGRLLVSDFRMTRARLCLVLRRSLPLEDPFSWTARASGKIDHEISRLFLEDLGLVFTGVTDLDLRAEKKGEEPLNLAGRGTFTNARLVVRDPPIAFTNVSGEIALSGSSISVTRLSADAGGGNVEAEGTVTLEGAAIREVDLLAKARSVRLNYPEGAKRNERRPPVARPPDRLRLTGTWTSRGALSRTSASNPSLQSLSRVSAALHRPSPRRSARAPRSRGGSLPHRQQPRRMEAS
jgi:hypothetical protein